MAAPRRECTAYKVPLPPRWERLGEGTSPRIACALLLIGAAVGALVSSDRIVSLQKLAVMALAAGIVLGVPRLPTRWRWALARAVVVSGLAASAAGNVLVDRASWKLDALNRPVYALFAHVARFSDLAFSQNGLAVVVILVLPFAVALARKAWPWWPAVAFLALELLVTESRSAILSLGLASGLLALYPSRGAGARESGRVRGARAGRRRPLGDSPDRPGLARGPLPALASGRWLGLALPVVALALVGSGLVALPVSISALPTGGSSAERLAIWQSALLMIADMPLTGIGLGMFQRVYPLYILPSYRNIHPHAHNLFLQTYLDAGPLGCAGMLLLTGAVVAAVVRLRRRPTPLGVAAAVSSAAVLLHGQVDSYFAGDPRTYFVLFVPLALLLASAPPPLVRVSRRTVSGAALGAAGLLVAALPWLAPAFWTNLGTLERLRAGGGAADFRRALELSPGDWVAERGLGLAASDSGWLRAAIQDGAPGRLVHFELARLLPAEAALPEWRASRAAPYLVRQAEGVVGDTEREDLLRQALAVDPTNGDAKRALATLYLAEARFPEARAVLASWTSSAEPKLLLALMDARLDGAPMPPLDPSPSADALGQAYQALGLYTEAASQFRTVADPIGRYDLAQLSLQQGEPRQAIADLQSAVAAIPNQEDFLLGLARAYALDGSDTRARHTYDAVLALDPANAEARLPLR